MTHAREGIPNSDEYDLTWLWFPLKWLFMRVFSAPEQEEQPGILSERAIVPEVRIPHTIWEAANKNSLDRQCLASPAAALCIAIMPRTCTVRLRSCYLKTTASESNRLSEHRKKICFKRITTTVKYCAGSSFLSAMTEVCCTWTEHSKQIQQARMEIDFPARAINKQSNSIWNWVMQCTK